MVDSGMRLLRPIYYNNEAEICLLVHIYTISFRRQGYLSYATAKFVTPLRSARKPTYVWDISVSSLLAMSIRLAI